MFNRKQIIIALIITLYLLTLPTIALADQPIKLVVNGQEIQSDIQPRVINNRTYFPVRIVANSLGVTDNNIIWDGTANTVTLMNSNKVVQIKIGDNKILENGHKSIMDVTPQVINDRTMLPVAWIAGAFGYLVNWDNNTRTIAVTGTGTGPSTLTPIDTINTMTDKIEITSTNITLDPFKSKNITVTQNFGDKVISGFKNYNEVSVSCIRYPSLDNTTEYQLTGLKHGIDKIDFYFEDYNGNELGRKTINITINKNLGNGVVDRDLLDKFQSIDGFSSYTIVDGSFGDYIDINFEMNDYNSLREYLKIPKETRKSFLSKLLEELINIYGKDKIMINLSTYYAISFDTWSPSGSEWDDIASVGENGANVVHTNTGDLATYYRDIAGGDQEFLMK